MSLEQAPLEVTKAILNCAIAASQCIETSESKTKAAHTIGRTCRFHDKGACVFGKACWFSHDTPLISSHAGKVGDATERVAQDSVDEGVAEVIAASAALGAESAMEEVDAEKAAGSETKAGSAKAEAAPRGDMVDASSSAASPFVDVMDDASDSFASSVIGESDQIIPDKNEASDNDESLVALEDVEGHFVAEEAAPGYAADDVSILASSSVRDESDQSTAEKNEGEIITNKRRKRRRNKAKVVGKHEARRDEVRNNGINEQQDMIDGVARAAHKRLGARGIAMLKSCHNLAEARVMLAAQGVACGL